MKVELKNMFSKLCVAILLFCSMGFVEGAEQNFLLENEDSDFIVWVRKQSLPFNPSSAESTYNVYSKLGSQVKKLYTESYEGDLQSSLLSGNLLYTIYPNSIHSYDLDKKVKKIVKHNSSEFRYLAVINTEKGFYEIVQKSERLYYKFNEDPIKIIANVPSWKKGILPLVAIKNNQVFIAMMKSRDQGDLVVLTLEDDVLSAEHLLIENFPLINISFFNETAFLLSEEKGSALRFKSGRLMEFTLPSLYKVELNYLAIAGDQENEYRLTSDGSTIYTSLNGINDVEETPIQVSKSSDTKQYFISQFAWTFFMIVSIGLFSNLRKKTAKENEVKKKVAKIEPLEPANMLFRILAFIVDFIIISPAVELLNYMYLGEDIHLFISQILNKGETLSQDLNPLLILVESKMDVFFALIFIQVIFFVLYHLVCELIFGGSLGKIFFQLKLVQLNGEKITRRQIFIKSALRFVDYFFTVPLGLIFCLLSKKRQTLGDQVAGTMVASIKK